MRKQYEELNFLPCLFVVIGFGLLIIASIIFLFHTDETETVEPIATHSVSHMGKAIHQVVEKPEEVEEVEGPEEVEYTLEVVEEVSAEDIDLIARVVMSEASTESYEVKLAVAQTVINRWRDTEYEWKDVNDLFTIVNRGFSTQDNGDVTEECYEAVRQVLIEDVFPSDMFWFRLNYVKYGNEYTVDFNSRTKFSTVKKYQ